MPVVTLLSLTLLATPADDLKARLGPPKGPSYTEYPASDRLGVNANELRLKLFGGFKGEKLATAQVTVYRQLGPTTLYADKHGHLYADRDGDKVIDAGALYNRESGLISADWNCDGVGDQVLADIKP